MVETGFKSGSLCRNLSTFLHSTGCFLIKFPENSVAKLREKHNLTSTFQLHMEGARKSPLHSNDKYKLNRCKKQQLFLDSWEKRGHGMTITSKIAGKSRIQGTLASWRRDTEAEINTRRKTSTANDKLLEAPSKQVREPNLQGEPGIGGPPNIQRLTFRSSTHGSHGKYWRKILARLKAEKRKSNHLEKHHILTKPALGKIINQHLRCWAIIRAKLTLGQGKYQPRPAIQSYQKGENIQEKTPEKFTVPRHRPTNSLIAVL